MEYNTIVIGGGASGLMCAYQLQKANIDFILLEKTQSLGNKLLLSGGTRCNVTNNLSNREFIESLNLNHRNFLYSTLTNFGTLEVVDFFNENKCPLKLEDDFKYFPKSNKSKDILNVFTNNIDESRVYFNSSVNNIYKEGKVFIVDCLDKQYRSKNVIIATGSKSFPHTGSSGDGLEFAKLFGITTSDFTPAETHVYSKQVVKELILLQGVTLNNALVSIKGRNKSVSGNVLFTHFGLSGPAIMTLSEDIYDCLKDGLVILLLSLTDLSKEKLDLIFEQAVRLNLSIKSVLEKVTNKRFVDILSQQLEIENKNIVEISKELISKLKSNLLGYEITIDSVQDATKAYVNKGGVSTKEINPKTMEAKNVPNLYFVGENVDLHGHIGGFNLTIAFSTAFTATKHIIEKE